MPRTDPKKLEKALAARRAGKTLNEAARIGDVSVSTLRRALKDEQSVQNKEHSAVNTDHPGPAPKEKRGPGRPPTDGDQLEAAVEAYMDGLPVKEAADIGDVSTRTLYRVLKERDLVRGLGTAGADEDGVELVLDPDASPLETARKLSDHMAATIQKLPADSPRLNPAHANVRAYLKLVAALEKEEAGEETEEQKLERKRREDRETRTQIERYVLEYEAEAAREGVCLWCRTPTGSGTHISVAELADVLGAVRAWAAQATEEGLTEVERELWEAWARAPEAVQEAGAEP